MEDFTLNGIDFNLPSAAPSTSYSYHVRLNDKDSKEWATIPSSNYEAVKAVARKTFPDLENIDFKITDETNSNIGPDFLPTFLSISSSGVLLNLVPEDTHFTTLEVSSPVSSYSSAYTQESVGSTETFISSPPPTTQSGISSFDEDSEIIIIPKHEI